MNPFQAPTDQAPDFRGSSSEWYERLSKLQRRLNLSFLALMGCLFGWIPLGVLFDSPSIEPEGASALLLIWLVPVTLLWAITQIHVFLVLKTIGSAGGAALTVLFLGLPLAGSIAVMVASRRATATLRQGGYEVGFLGLRSKPGRR